MNLIDSYGAGNLARRLGESDGAVRSGIGASIAAMVQRITHKSEDPSSMRQIFDLVSNAPVDVNAPTVVSAALNTSRPAGATPSIVDSGKRLLSIIFGNRQDGVAGALAQSSGLSSGAARGVMGLAAPLLVSVLGRRVREGGLTPASLRTDLLGEAANLRHLLPAGFGNLFAETRTPPHEARTTVEPHRTGHSSSRWIWPLAAGVALALGVFWAVNRDRDVRVADRDSIASSADRIAPEATRDDGFVSRSLPGNVHLRIPEHGVEARLLAFLESSSTAENAPWFEFDRLVFDTDSAILRPESQEQLDNVAGILRTYPNAHVKIGGYTDSIGDPDANLTLSQARAESVKAELMKLGISADRLQAEGYGAQHPVAENSAEEGSLKNRRVAIRVTDL
jgi:outer membrane protein OmpA-like peptidoglycan-associated protein